MLCPKEQVGEGLVSLLVLREDRGVKPKSGPKVKKYPFASTMSDMKPWTRVRPPSEVDEDRAMCDATFAKAWRFFRGRDLVEEMVAMNFWPLGKSRPRMTLVKMKFPMIGSEDGEFVAEVETSTSLIIGEIFEEYLSRRVIRGTMPRLNRVFEEMKVKYRERKIPENVLKSIEDKAVKAAKSAAPPVAIVWTKSR